MALQAVTIRGPFWEAEASLLEGNFQEKTFRHFRALFVESNPRQAFAIDQSHLPGVLLALVQIRKVRITPVPGRTVEWTHPQAAPPRVQTEAEMRDAINTGRATLLMLGSRPDEVLGGAGGILTCLGGEIRLDPPRPLDAFWTGCGVKTVTSCRVHAGGVSVHGNTTVPWQTAELIAWFMLAVDVPHAANRSQDRFRLTFEHDRMTVAELTALRQSWQNLSRYINPLHPRNDFSEFADDFKTPTWVTFEITDPLAAPNFYWMLDRWGTTPTRTLNFDSGEVAVLLTDQQPYPRLNEPDPTSLAQVITPNMSIASGGGGTLVITLTAGETPPAGAETLVYKWTSQEEIVSSDNLVVAFDTVQTADYLRRLQGLPAPLLPRDDEGSVLGRPFKPEQPLIYADYESPLLDPAVIWGFMPLEDGWAQLPFPNMTEQIYIDLGLAKQPDQEAAARQSVLRGAVYLGNDDAAVQAGYCDEQPWNLTLVDARHVSGKWTLKSEGAGYRLDSVELAIATPDLFLNGLLWLSTGQATVEDALPDLSQWASALRPVAMRTLDQIDDIFPPLVHLRLDTFAFTLRPTIEGVCTVTPLGTEPLKIASARLNALTMQFEVDQALFALLTAAQDDEGNVIPPAIPSDMFSRYLPLVWRRHPHLPMIQALPLTQNRHTPNYPGASRQLAPYALPTGGDDLPTADWRFTMVGANEWPRLDGEADVASEWLGQESPDGDMNFFDLPLVALSLPGLELDPNPGSDDLGLPPDAIFHLTAQLRFDLPYLDQINALAQLPKPVRSPGETSPLPDEPPPEPPAPLHRETFVDYWRALAEKASMASADAVDALMRQNGSTFIQHLIEPLHWPVNAALNLDSYPGGLSLSNATGDAAALELGQETALRGLDGDFVTGADNTLRRLSAPDGNGAFHVSAGTMAAFAAAGAYRDQRGLVRRASSTAGVSLIKTPVTLHTIVDDEPAQAAYDLTSVRLPLALHVDGEIWSTFWFRDLPIDAGTQQFELAKTRSEEAIDKHTDINDPDALARDYNFLSGYQWHMDESNNLVLGGLHFHPLSLETLSLVEDAVSQIVLVGRLQLPIYSYEELTDLSNAVVLTFTAQADGSLALSDIHLSVSGLTEEEEAEAAEPPVVEGEWPLSLKDGELTEAPLLTWDEIALSASGDALVLGGLVLHFFLFDVPWAVPLDPITLPLNTIAPIEINLDLQGDTDAPLSPVWIELVLDLPAAQNLPPKNGPISPHQCRVALQVHLGERRVQGQNAGASRSAAFETLTIFPLIGNSAPLWEAPVLFNDLNLVMSGSVEPPKLIYKQRTLQFSWTDFNPRENLQQPLELLPGMPLARVTTGPNAGDYAPAPGFAVLGFSLRAGDELPTFQLEMGFVEVLLTCKWGVYLSDLPPGSPLPLGDNAGLLFGSSAGDVVFAYTSSYSHRAGEASKWDETFMLNGFVEIKSLISWPAATSYDSAKSTFQLPAARPGKLDHLRHTIRILFNQHEILASLPVVGEDHLLFNFAGHPWQFLAVVEHQLANIALSGQNASLVSERRWTALQEVRFASVASFRKFLTDQAKDNFFAPFLPSTAQAARFESFGLFTPALRDLLTAAGSELAALPPATLLVEASAPFWLRRQPVNEPTLTALQFLPNGVQSAVLSNPQDYAPDNPQDDAMWHLVMMPFLGRLQSAAGDNAASNALQCDPVRLIHKVVVQGSGAISKLALALSNWGDNAAVVFNVSGFEALAMGTLARLDRGTLQENWLRLQRLMPEPQPPSLRSVMAALPNTPARLSRDVSLRRLFHNLRRHHPPQFPPLTGASAYQLPPLVEDPLLVWRDASLLLWQGASLPQQASNNLYGWHLVGLHLRELPEVPANTSARYPAATLIPAWNTPGDTVQVSFTVSPYLGLAFRAAGVGVQAAAALEALELLAVDPVRNALRPVTSVLREGENESAADRRTIMMTWAVETHRRLVPESPIAVVRIRQINEDADSLVRTTYNYQLIDLPRTARSLVRRTFRVRTDVRRLHFRQGQVSRHLMPPNIKAFEVAPPQTIGLQPIYQTSAPERAIDTPEGTSSPDWPWGLSALRVAVQFTADQQGVSDTNLPAPDALVLWWQSIQYHVQFRPATGDPRPAASLPKWFRAPAISSLLPVNANPPMPGLDWVDLTKAETLPSKHITFDRWQSVLPGRLRYLVLGSRPGVPFVFRHSLLRQGFSADSRESLLVSGSVPAQHRAPRPVPLPPNRDDGQAFALQPWASYFEPGVNALFTASPADETFLADCGPDPASRLQIQLVSPVNGLLTPGWKGELSFKITWTPDLAEDERWRLSFTLVGSSTVIEIESGQEDDLFMTPDTYSVSVATAAEIQQVAANARQFRVKVERVKANTDGNFENSSGFYQVVSLPLFYTQDDTIRLPLEPIFAHFEDPEYNRRLGSATANSTVLMDVEEKPTGGQPPPGEMVSHELRLSLDRKTYNTTSEIAFRYDWDTPDVLKIPDATSMVLSHISAAGASVPLRTWDAPADPPLKTGEIRLELLPTLVAAYNDNHKNAVVTPRSGDRLQLKAVFKEADKIIGEISVEVDIVDEPVIPAPEAAYALLRGRTADDVLTVEAARFAWNPEATRVELVCPEDLRQAFVRRRAIFHWQDASRISRTANYAIQKIASNGSTHWPEF